MRDSATEIADPDVRPGRVIAAGYDFAAGYVVPMHRHRRAQLLHSVEGTMTVSTRNGSWAVPPTQAVWLPAGMAHEVRMSGAVKMRTVYIDPARVDDLRADCCVFSVTLLMRELILRVIALSVDAAPHERLGRVVDLLLDELRACHPEPLHLPMPSDQRLRRIAASLQDDPSDSRPLRDWCARAGASERTLGRLFVAETGMTFAAWRRRLRIQRALEELASGKSVTEVAFSTGYQSVSAFVTMFRRVTGRTPGAWAAGSDTSSVFRVEPDGSVSEIPATLSAEPPRGSEGSEYVVHLTAPQLRCLIAHLGGGPTPNAKLVARATALVARLTERKRRDASSA